MLNFYFLKLNKKQIIKYFLITILITFIGTPFLGLYYFSFFFIIMILFIFCWYFSIGYICNNLFPINRIRHLFFLVFIYYILIYFFIAFIFAIIVFVPQIHEAIREQALSGRHKFITGPSLPNFLIAVIIFMHIILMIAIIYIDFHISKSLAEILYSKYAKFDDYSNLFFYLTILPIGIWFIQPKVNKLYERYLAEMKQQN